jgi:multidrug efflux pump subunit AcrB
MKGPIAWMARNTVAANLLMFAIFAGGTLGLLTIKQEVFPEFALDFVNVTVAYPGAGPAEVEQGIVLAVEEAVRGLDGVKRVTSVSAEGSGNISIELLLEADPDKVLAEIKNEIDRIRSFPEDAEKATVALAAPRSQVISLVISGDQELATLHAIAEEARTELLTSGEITQVELQGVRPLEVAIEVPRETLRSYGLSLDQIAQQVRAASVELPGGGIDAEAGEFLVRVADRKELAAEFGGVTVRGTLAGASVSLSDIATVVNGYEDSDAESYFNGKRAVRVTAYRVGKETPNGVAAVVKAYAERLEASLPENVEVVTWNDSSEQLKGRIDLLVRNAFMGGILVLIVLGLFLESRLAFWVALGIPISFMGSFLLMPHLDLSINMITLFGLIITLGMVVDDAIIVGENAYEKVQRGIPRMEAAVTGAQEMAVPVTFSILTTIAAFSPMFFVPGVMGKIFRLFPAVVIAVLAFSLLESFFILPAHLAHGKDRPPGPIRRVLDRVHHFGDHWLTRFTNELYRPVLLAALRNRFTVVVASASAFVLTIAALATGAQPFNFFPIIEGDIVLATARLPYGVPVHLTREIGDELVLAAEQAIEETGDARILRGIFTRVGESAPVRGPGPQRPEVGSHVVSVEMALVPSDQREASAEAVADAWRRAMPPVAGVQSLRFTASTGPGSGAAIDVQLSHADADVIAAASKELTEALRSYPALANINNGYASGKPQLDFEILPAAATLGLTASDIARQMRSSFYGAEVLREQRGRHHRSRLRQAGGERHRRPRRRRRISPRDSRLPQGRCLPGAPRQLRGSHPGDGRRSTGARRVPGRPTQWVPHGADRDLCAPRDPVPQLPAAADCNGRDSVRPRRCGARPQPHGLRAEPDQHVRGRRPQRRGGERLLGPHRYDKPNTCRGEGPVRGHSRGRHASAPADPADVAHDVLRARPHDLRDVRASPVLDPHGHQSGLRDPVRDGGHPLAGPRRLHAGRAASVRLAR